jgi:hypothetical protein
MGMTTWFEPANVPAKIAQHCFLCENTRELPLGCLSSTPWVCDECKDAIAYIKYIKERDNQ